MSFITWNRTSMDENDIEALMLPQDKKIIIASLGNFP